MNFRRSFEFIKTYDVPLSTIVVEPLEVATTEYSSGTSESRRSKVQLSRGRVHQDVLSSSILNHWSGKPF